MTTKATFKPILTTVPRRPRTVKALKASSIYTIDPDQKNITRKTDVGGLENTEVRALADFLSNLEGVSDTGLLPPGILRHRQVGSTQQVTLVIPPGINRLGYSDDEGSSDYKTFLVAQPYRVVIGDFEHNKLVGVRMFYSPTPPNTPDTPLYLPNVPNVNCMGYHQTSVGWVCLYGEPRDHKTLAEKVTVLHQVASGEYTYNQNMAMIDGPAFYKSINAPAHLFDLKEWETITKKKGVDWVLEPDVWAAIKVADPAKDNEKYDPTGVAYHLSHAMDLPYRSAYNQPMTKVVQKKSGISASIAKDIFNKAFIDSGPAPEAVEVDGSVPAMPKFYLKPQDPESEPGNNAPMQVSNTIHCLSCDHEWPFAFIPAGKIHASCPKCGFVHAWCGSCGTWFDIDNQTTNDGHFLCPECTEQDGS